MERSSSAILLKVNKITILYEPDAAQEGQGGDRPSFGIPFGRCSTQRSSQGIPCSRYRTRLREYDSPSSSILAQMSPRKGRAFEGLAGQGSVPLVQVAQQDPHHLLPDDLMARRQAVASPPEAPQKKLKMFSHYQKTPSSTNNKPSVHAQLTAFLDLITKQVSVPCFEFWQQHKAKFPALYQLATQVFCIPATSAPIERIFSHGGILMRPHCARLSSVILSNLMLLKYNMKMQHD
ncbi:unnamed protein product [Leuciscus chuanchicus]